MCLESTIGSQSVTQFTKIAYRATQVNWTGQTELASGRLNE